MNCSGCFINRSQKRMSAAGIFVKKPTNRFTENPVWPHSQNRRLWKNLIAVLLLVVSFPVFPYEYIDFSSPTFDEDTLLRFVEHGRVGYLDQQGRVVVEAAFEYGSYFASGRALVRVNGKYGYIDRTGQIVIPAQFDQASDFQGGVAPAGVKNPAGNSTLSGLIDLAGRWIVPPQFKQIKFAGSLLAVSRDGDLWALMFPDGHIVTEFLFAEYVGHNTDDTPEWSDRDFYERKPVLGRDIREAEGLIQYTDGGKYGFMDLSGRIVIPARFEFAHYFRGSEAVVKDGGRWGIIDRSGQYVLPPRYERLQGAGFSEGLCGVRLGGLWGFMDRSGQMIIKPQFIGVEEFSDGAAGFLLIQLTELRPINMDTSIATDRRFFRPG